MSRTPRPAARRQLYSLLINASTLLQEPIGALRDYELSQAEFRYAGRRRSVDGALRLLRTDQSLLASAQLQTSVDDICGACLAPLSLVLDLQFDEEFWPPTDALTGRALQPPPERDGFAVIDGQIDLTEVVRQYVEMARPISPRCGPSCPGAGLPDANDEQETDDRWAALRALRGQLPQPPH